MDAGTAEEEEASSVTGRMAGEVGWVEAVVGGEGRSGRAGNYCPFGRLSSCAIQFNLSALSI